MTEDKTKKRINVYLTADEKEQFAKVASENQRSVSSMARALIVNELHQAPTTIDDSDQSSKQ